MAHACSHCLQPMQTVASYKSALLMKYFSDAAFRAEKPFRESSRPTPELNEEEGAITGVTADGNRTAHKLLTSSDQRLSRNSAASDS